jgi:PAS domain S-box-containing protein
MSASFPLRANLPGATSVKAEGHDEIQFLRDEIAALMLENEHLRRSLAAELSNAPPSATAPQAPGLPVQFHWADAGARPDESLAAQDALLTALSSVFPIGIFRTDAAGLLTQVDANLQRMLGLELSDFAHFGWLAAVHPEDRQRAQDGWFAYAMQPSNHSMELRLLRGDGETRHVLMRNAPRLDAAGEFLGQFGFVQDITEQRELEADARLKGDLNRQIIASSLDCTKVLDLQGRVLQMTALGCRLMEVDNFEAVHNSDWRAWWPAEGAPLARAALDKAVRGETPRFVAFAPTFKGTPKWWDVAITPIRNAAGEPVMLLAVSRDISEQHRQQEEIKALNESLEARVQLRTQELAQANQRISQTLTDAQALYNQAPCGYHAVDGDGVFVRVNQTALDWLGYQLGEVIGKLHFRDFVLPEYVDSMKQRLKQLKLGQPLDPIEVCLRRRDGSTLNTLLSSTAVFDAQGEFLHTNNTLVDISARHKAEQALSAQRAFLQTVTDSVPVQLAFYDRNLICQFANASYARWLNLPPQSLVGMHLSQVANLENLASAQARLTAALAGETQRFEGQRIFPDGASFYASIEHTPYRVDGEVQGVVIQLVDITQRKAAEDQVQEVNQQLRMALERAQNLYNQAPCGYHSVDRNGFYVSINDTELAWLGCSREEVVGQLTHQDLMVPKNAGMLEERLQRLMNQGLVEPIEYEMRRRDGSVFPVLVSSTAVRDANGEYLHSNTTVVDISERVVAETALQSNERFIQAITDHVPGLIAYLDTELRFRFANANHLPVYGMDPSAILGKPLRECLPREIWDEVAPRLQAALAGETQHFEAWRHTAQGQPMFISASYLPDLDEDEVKGIFVQVIDITERKRIEERVTELNTELERRIRERSVELLESEQRFRLMVDNMRDYAAFFLDAGGFISDWTDSAQRMDGFSPTEMLGRHYRLLFERSGEESAREQAENILQLASSRGQHEVNGWHQRKDGSRYWAHSLLIALRDDSGELRGFAKITRDMSDAKRLDDLMRNINGELENRVTERTAQLLAANKDLESFSYSVSHDLRSPLRHVASFVSLLQEHLGDQCDEVSTRYLGTIGNSARHMSQLIDGLLAFSHLGRAAVNIAPLDFALLVDTVVAQLAHDTEGRNIEWAVAPDLPVVQGDALLLREVWANLLGNAYKYTRPRECARIEVGWGVDPTKGHTFYVRDNGVGFDTKYAHKLFGVFQRLHRATEFEGTGIGLALTRRIIERHGGTIWADSQLGEGSVFSFSLPFESLHAVDPAHEQMHGAPS